MRKVKFISKNVPITEINNIIKDLNVYEITECEIREQATKHPSDYFAIIYDDDNTKKYVGKFEYVKDEELSKHNIEKDFSLPTRSTKNSAGYDFYAPYEFKVPAKGTATIYTGVKVKIDPDYVLTLYPRSSLGIKFGIRLANTVGIIDADFYNNPDNDGHIMAKFVNDSDYDVKIKKGDRVFQGIFLKYGLSENGNTEDLRVGGVGSTGK